MSVPHPFAHGNVGREREGGVNADRTVQRGTIVIDGRRLEVLNRYRYLNRIEVRYAGWNLGLQGSSRGCS
jgi:hypothetical protein